MRNFRKYENLKCLALILAAVTALSACCVSCKKTGKNEPTPIPATAEPTPEPTPYVDVAALVDFPVEVEEGREIRVLQLTDPQIIDASQRRTPDRLDGNSVKKWGRDRLDDDYKNYIRNTVAEADPDFIFITGDLVYGEFDDSGEIFRDFVEFMDGFQVPWAPVFGNHDNESKQGADWQCSLLENARFCRFRQRTLTGNGNYTVGIVQGGKLLRVFFMMDSNGCGAMSKESKANGHSKTDPGFGEDQTAWMAETAAAIREKCPDAKLSVAFHIQLNIFKEAFSKYGFKNSGTEAHPINIDTAENKEETDFGYLGRDLKSPWDDGTVWEQIKASGFDSVFVGHEHCNCGSVIFEGIRLQYGQKSSIYDRLNYQSKKGKITGGYLLSGTPLVGGTYVGLAEDTGELVNLHIILKDAS